MNNTTLVPAVSTSFLDALARQDFDRLGACFHPAPRARLLTPSALAMPRMRPAWARGSGSGSATPMCSP